MTTDNASVVDLLVPAYAPASTLARLVESVEVQTDRAWRLTIIDDAYPDPDLPTWGTTLTDERIRYRRNARNLGLSANFAHCLSYVTQDLVTVMGSDDLLMPDYVETVRGAHCRHPAVAMIQPGVQVVDDDDRPSSGPVDLAKRYVYAPRARAESVLYGEELAVSLLRGNWLYFPSLCWRADRLLTVGFSTELHTLLDLSTELALVESGDALVRCPTVCFRYRRHRGSVSSWRATDGSRFVEERAFFLAAAERMGALGWRRAERAARRHFSSRMHALLLVPGVLRAAGPRDARVLLRHALGPAAPS